MDGQRSIKRTFSALSAEQKVAFVLLMVLGAGGVVLGFYSFGVNFRRPFELRLANYQGERVLGSDEREAAALESLKRRDSDKDGLNDYDELYVFKTSPYLADTDSDGIDDRTEIFAGADPNCPEGKDCTSFYAGEQTIDTGAVPEEMLAPIKTTSPFIGGLSDMSGLVLETPEDILSFFQSLSTEEIRQLMLQQGIPQEKLDQLDDATLRQMVEKALQEAIAQGDLKGAQY
jgi:hypothetical protein